MEQKPQKRLIIGFALVIVVVALLLLSESRVGIISQVKDFLLVSRVSTRTTCTDTDGGLNYEVRGTVTSGRSQSADYCSTSNILVEYYCSSSGKKASRTYACPYGCSAGACQPPPVCQESAVCLSETTLERTTTSCQKIQETCNAGCNFESNSCITDIVFTNYRPTLDRLKSTYLNKDYLGYGKNYVNVGRACAAFWDLYDITHEDRYKNKAVEMANWIVQDKDLNGDGEVGWELRRDHTLSFCSYLVPAGTEALPDTANALNCLNEAYKRTQNPLYLSTAKEGADFFLNKWSATINGKRYVWDFATECHRNVDVKYSNLIFAEALLELYQNSGDTKYADAGQALLNRWKQEIEADDLAYYGLLNVNDPNDTWFVDNIHDKTNLLRCKTALNSYGSNLCWYHLTIESESAFRVGEQQNVDFSSYLNKIMGTYRGSIYGDPAIFWSQTLPAGEPNGNASQTYITAGNCFLRSSAPVYLNDCIYSLDRYTGSSPLVFWSLVHKLIE